MESGENDEESGSQLSGSQGSDLPVIERRRHITDGKHKILQIKYEHHVAMRGEITHPV